MQSERPEACPPLEQLLIPFELTIITGNPVLVLAPHADDETLGCGGTICLHQQRGEHVKVVVLTDGAAAEPGFSGIANPDFVAKRQSEAQAAVARLGIQDIEFWNIGDRTLGANVEAKQRLTALLAAYKPALVYSPSPHEFHPDHRACAHLAWTAIAASKLACRLAFYEVNRPFKVDQLVDITAVVDLKRQACAEYGSQLALYAYDEFAMGLGRFRALTVASQAKYVEGFQLIGSDVIAASTPDAWLLDQFFSEMRVMRPTQEPLVSVVVRTRNRPGLLREALYSLRQQSYRNVEVILVNDGGAAVDDIVAEFRGALPIKTLHNPHALGRSTAANMGMESAAGKYINFLDDDDLLYPDHIEKLVTFLENTREKVAFSECDVAKYVWAGATYQRISDKRLYSTLDFSREDLIRDNFIPIMTVLFARDCLKDVGGFDPALDHFEDWDFWIRLSGVHPFHKVAGASAEYRILETKLDVQRQKRTIKWRSALYAKYPEYWTPEQIVEYGWTRIHSLQEEVAEVSGHYRNVLLEWQKAEAKRRAKSWRHWSRQKMQSLRRVLGQAKDVTKKGRETVL